METRKYNSPLGGDNSASKANKGKGWKGLKGQAALALAVSLWIGGAGVASANTIYLNHTTDEITADAAYPDGAKKVEKPAGTTKTLSITGGDWSDWSIFGSVVKGHDDTPLDGYRLILSRGKYKTIRGAYCTGAATNNVIIATDCTGSNQIICGRSDADATGNKITLTNVTLSGTGWNTAVVGGYTQKETKKASGNKVSLTNSTVGAVFGGFDSYSDGLGDTSGNTVNLLGGNTINGDLAGGNGADNTGNTLTLSGANTVQAGTGGRYDSGTVKNFDTIKLANTLTWNTAKPVLTAVKYTNYGTLDITAATALANQTAPGTMTLLSSGTDNDFATLKLAYNSATQAAPVTLDSTTTSLVVKTGAGGTSEDKGVTLGYTSTHTVSLDNTNNYKNVFYNIANKVNTVSFGNMAWGTGRTLTGGYDFTNTATINADNLKFTNPESIAKDDTMTLLSGATNLATGNSIVHTQNFDKTINGATLSATLSGNVTRTAETLGYTATSTTLNKATLGSFAWGAEADSLPEGWTASAATAIDATNFEYTGKADGDVAAGTTSTILNAPGLKEASPVTGGTNKTVAVDYTDVAGIKFEATATGHVEAVANKVQYFVNSVALENVDLGGWDGTVSGVPQNWTGSQVAVETGNFNVPTNLGAGQSIDILTTSKANFFGTVSGDRKYSSETFGNSEAGITLSGHHLGGVKVEAYGEKANAKLTYYAETMDTTAIALGEMTWDTGRTAGTGYDFRNVGAVTATDLAFTFTDAQKAELSKDSQMTLLSGATNLAADKDVTDKDKTQKIAYTVSNGAALNGTLTGEVVTAEGQVNYDATAMTLDSVNLANWNGTTDSVPMGWTSNLGANTITASNFAPNVAAGTTKDILTATTNEFFAENQIAEAIKYKAQAASTDTANGVALTGSESKGVKASDDGTSLVYARSNFNVNNVYFGKMTWGTSRDASGTGYDYSNAAVNMDGLTFSNPADIAANTSTTLLTANNTLGEIAETTKNISYGYSPVDGVTVDGIINGSYKTDSNAIKYKATANNATKLTFGNVEWKDNDALIHHATDATKNINFSGAAVDTSNINFTNIKELEANKKMTLVKDFGTAVGMITGSKYKVGSKMQGEGHAFFENSNLLYLVTKGVNGKADASGNTEEITGGKTVTGNVIGVATDSGKAESNKANVSGNSEVTGNVIGAETTSGLLDKNEANISGNSQIKGDVTAGKTESGNAAANITKVENSMVTGNAVGAVTDTGVATGNEVNITGGSIGGDVAGATSDSGTVSQKNQASVVNATVVGNVYGGKSTSGEVNTNIANVSGGTVNGSVYGGMTNGENKSEGNEVKLESNTKVQKDVYGGYSQQGTATGNKVKIDGAAVDGTIYGGKSKNKSDNNSVELDNGTVGAIVGGGCEEASGNIVTITGGEVLNGVYGAKAGSSATNNTITMSGGKVNNVLYGGYADSATGITTGNTVTLYGTADVSNAGVFGGNGSDITGNVLNIGTIINDVAHSWSGGGQSVKNVANFEIMNFVSVPWNKEKAAVTISDGTASDLSATKVNATTVHFTDTTSLKQGDTMTLLDEQKVAVDKRVQAGNITKESKYTAGSTLKGTGILSMDDSGNVIYKVTDKDSSDKSHNTVMGATASMAALSAGNDFVGSAVEGLGNSNNAGSDGLSTYANLGGGSMNVETGSHVKTHTWNAILAIGHKNEKKLSTTEYGAFFEYGTGNYSTFNGDERGDGSTRYTGGGILGKWQKNNGFYVEGSLRAGSIHDDANNVLRDVNGNPYSYTTDATYWGAHIGVGREIKLNKTAVLDLYAKYFYNHRGSVSFDAGGHYDLGAVESSVLRVGTRYTVKQNDNINYYGGLAVEHEFCGRASGFADGVAISGADISGTSVRGEIGATFRPGEKSNVTLDLNLSGFAGKKQGLTGGLSAVFHI